ncbi:hypothetical protein [Microbispora sp. ATCC PTA-5024]|uniref:hypothetical protein n=1 Tax=Microbispora sp. ATCC PTA-5024 TaxID=316330 RepID=UPI0012EE27C8|nr:hypothetical protein [Microbispora sp. ATCC PTA-5024]
MSTEPEAHALDVRPPIAAVFVEPRILRAVLTYADLGGGEVEPCHQVEKSWPMGLEPVIGADFTRSAAEAAVENRRAWVAFCNAVSRPFGRVIRVGNVRIWSVAPIHGELASHLIGEPLLSAAVLATALSAISDVV